MKNSLKRIVGGGFALATAVALTVPGMASAAGSLDLGSISDSLGGDGVSAPSVTAAVGGDDGQDVDVTLKDHSAPVNGGVQANIHCAAYAMASDDVPDNLADGIVDGTLSDTIDIEGGEASGHLVTVNSANGQTDEGTIHALDTLDLLEGEYSIVSACWEMDSGAPVDGSAVLGDTVTFTVNGPTLEVGGGGIFGSLSNIFGSLGA